MKGILLNAALLFSLSATASLVAPEPIWESDFYKVAAEHNGMLGGDWVTYGTGAKPVSTWLDLFPHYASGPYYELIDLGPEMAAFSCSSFTPSSDADAWLVTPEIEVTEDKMLVGYQVFAQGSDQPTPFCIYVSENGGAAKEDFGDEPFLISSFKGSSQGLNFNSRYFSLNGYKGKKVRIAFVNNSIDKGVLAFNQIHVIPYYADIVNYTPQFVEDGSEVLVRMECTLAFPETVNGFTAVLETSDGQTQSYKSTKSYSTIRTTQKFSFPEKLKMSEGRNLSYTVTITPKSKSDSEAYEPVVYSAAISSGTPEYPSVAMIEELTATDCGYCPRGAAALEYYRDTYTGENGTNKAVCIAVHNGDVMQVFNNPYYIGVVGLPMMPSGMPGAIFNRQFSNDPASEEVLLKIFEKNSYGSIRVTDVDWEGLGGKPVVKYSAGFSLDIPNPDLTVTAILLENDVKGNDGRYNQLDYYGRSSYTMNSIKEEYGEGMAPYFEKYLNRPNETVLFNEMVYECVARGCYPSFEGVEFADNEWAKGVFKNGEIEFEYPSSVLNKENVEIVVALVDGVNGQIISADSKRRTDNNSVASIGSDSGISIVRDGRMIVVDGCAGGNVEVYAADGKRLGSYGADGGHAEIDASGFEGVVIVKASGNNGSVSKKMLF